MESSLASARKLVFVETLFGCRRFVSEISSNVFHVRSAAERAAINMPIQGTGADIIKLAMIEIDKKLQTGNFAGVKMLLQVHDELVFELPEVRIQEVANMVKEEMENVVQLAAPLVVDVKVGYNWGEMKKI